LEQISSNTDTALLRAECGVRRVLAIESPQANEADQAAKRM